MDDSSLLRLIQPFLNGKMQLTAFPAKNRKKLAALWYLAGKLEPDRRYSEAEAERPVGRVEHVPRSRDTAARAV